MTRITQIFTDSRASRTPCNLNRIPQAGFSVSIIRPHAFDKSLNAQVQRVRDFNDMKSDLNAYRRYCDRACELLDTTEEKAPGASRLIRKGLPIIDERIKRIIAEIQEKVKALYKQVKDTEYKEIGQQVNNVGQELSKIIDPIRLEKEVSRMLIPLSAICKKMPEEDRGKC